MYRIPALVSFAHFQSRLTLFTAKRSKRHLSSKYAPHALIVGLFLICLPSPTLAAVDHVTSLADDGSHGTLRSVMAAAAAGDTIVFKVTGTITLMQGFLEISKPLIIDGPGAANLLISGGDTFTVFQVDSGVAAAISRITIEHGYASAANGGGGGIHNQGVVALIQTVTSDNLFGDDGSNGEGIYNGGILIMVRSTVSDNFSSNSGAGIYNTGTLELINSTLSDNGCGLPGASGGGIYNSGTGTVTVTRSTVSGNTVHDGGQGGGIYNGGTLRVLDGNVSNNLNAFGSGAGVYNNGDLTVRGTTFSGNTDLEDDGGGIFNISVATVRNSTFSTNSTTDGGRGGAIYNQGMLTLVNSTLSGNSATSNDGSAKGGAVYNIGTLALSFTTLSGNAADEGGAIFNVAALTLKSTLLAGQTSGGNCDLNGMTNPTSDGYNLADDSTCSFLTQTGDLNNNGNAGLSPSGLQNNGGPTQTIALLPTSSAVNAIPVTACTDASGNPVTTDQRGIIRPQGPACDIGAYELAERR